MRRGRQRARRRAAGVVSIDVARNAQHGEPNTGDVNPLVIIQMAAIQADVMKTMAAQQAALRSNRYKNHHDPSSGKRQR